MSFDDALRSAAERYGIQQEFWDIFGRLHRTSAETNRSILTAIGLDCASEAALQSSVERRDMEEWKRVLPAALVVSENEPELRIHVRAPENISTLAFEIRSEQGEIQRREVDLSPLRPNRTKEIGGFRYIEREVPLGRMLSCGYHDVHAAGACTRVIVTPDSAYLPDRRKRAGLGVTLYGLRSRHNWGCGDTRDICDLIDWAVPALGIDFIALNPLHAIHNRRPYNASPYLPNSIFYRNFLYLDIEAVPGYDLIRNEFETPETKREIQHLRAMPTVEYEQVAALKRKALELIFRANPPGEDCKHWIAAEGDLLRVFATYCVLDEHLHAENANLWVWPDWPERFRDPASPQVGDFARRHEREVLFHGWLQWLVDGQFATVQHYARERGMGIGLYHDLALATDRCGSDLWAHRPFYIAGCRVGSPPDDFSPAGQDWSFPPPDTARHREDGYRLYTESIRKSLRHGGALRIDHVMRLFRLYWIPEGHDATRGAYVRDSAEDLVRILALESVRKRAIIVGEDLGTVEPQVRETLSRFGILSYRLLYFERRNGRFKLPDEYPEQALASSTTHDLPTIAGFWTGADVEARFRAGTIDARSYQSQKTARVNDKQRLLDALVEAYLLPSAYQNSAEKIPELTPELHNAIVGYMAMTPSLLWLVNQEDMTKEPAQQNLPGTTAEYPNWSRKMQWSLEDLHHLPEARDCAQMVKHWILRTGRAASRG